MCRREEGVIVGTLLKAHDGHTSNLLSLQEHESGGVSFGSEKKGSILGIGRIGKSDNNSINNVHYVEGIEYNLLSISLIYDKGNEVKFTANNYLVTNCITGNVVMSATRVKNMYVAGLESIEGDDLSCLSAQTDESDLWHRRLGHVSSTLLNKLVVGDLVRGLPKVKFTNDKVFNACAKGKQTMFSSKVKKRVSTSRPLELLKIYLIAFAVLKEFKLFQMDVKSDFMNGKRKCMLQGFEDSVLPDHVLKLDKALYGLKQPPRA